MVENPYVVSGNQEKNSKFVTLLKIVLLYNKFSTLMVDREIFKRGNQVKYNFWNLL